MGHLISHKLKSPLEGALAGGGDPATSPLYVFGPFLALIVSAGVAPVTFGASIWLVVLTVVLVSAMYRLVMNWVLDGSGGSGLSEEEFGGWAVKLNAGITFVEYTLTFLVSMAALVTFLSDRLSWLNVSWAGISIRTLIAVGLSIFTGLMVNRGPKVAARIFGPATAGVLVLLWIMIFTTILKFGFNLPSINLRAFHSEYIHYTLAGYCRLLALMTGIEIFANLIAAYEGTPKVKSRNAYLSLVIIMGTTCITMLIVGPAILLLSNPLDKNVSVFTQTMNQLLPLPLSYFGTFVGIAVLLSACAASAQGLQNLALGLRHRHYIPAKFGQRNNYDVADKPVWLEVFIVALCFVFFGTHEETYLSLYAVGVFVLLSLTGWATTKRLIREHRAKNQLNHFFPIIGASLAALLTSLATVLILYERFFDGAWIYLAVLPALYFIFTYIRHQLGDPTAVENRFGSEILSNGCIVIGDLIKSESIRIQNVMVLLDTSLDAEQGLLIAEDLSSKIGSQLYIVGQGKEEVAETEDLEKYMECIVRKCFTKGLNLRSKVISSSSPSEVLSNEMSNIDLIILATQDASQYSSKTQPLIDEILKQSAKNSKLTSLLYIKEHHNWKTRHAPFSTILVGLDGSLEAESALPSVCLLASLFSSKVILFSVPEGSESEAFPLTLEKYFDSLKEFFRKRGITVESLVGGSGPARTLLSVAEDKSVDLIVMSSHGRGGHASRRALKIGSVAEKVLMDSVCPVLLVPVLSQRILTREATFNSNKKKTSSIVLSSDAALGEGL